MDQKPEKIDNWTKEIPKEPGMYWIIRKYIDTWTKLDIIEIEWRGEEPNRYLSFIQEDRRFNFFDYLNKDYRFKKIEIPNDPEE